MNVKQKILIADDSEINRALLMEILGDSVRSSLMVSCVRASPLAPQASCIATGISRPLAFPGSPISFKISQIPLTSAPVFSFNCFIQLGQPAIITGSPSFARHSLSSGCMQHRSHRTAVPWNVLSGRR